MRSPLFAAAALAAVSIFPVSATSAELQLAQVEVIESSPLIRAIGESRNKAAENNGTGSAGSSSESTTNIQSELYHQLQILQEEVQGLRGLVEEQAHQLQQLKQQRMDDYVDLDRRVSELSQNRGESAGNGSSRSGGGSSRGSSSASRASGGDSSNEFASYSAAVDLATTQQQFDRAIDALKEHLDEYPDGRYAGNAHYWLGQIYFVQSHMEEAQQAFTRVVEEYPDHNKAPEARYKLGQVYFRQGDKDRAKELLEEVANGNSDSAPLAKNFLRQNY